MTDRELLETILTAQQEQAGKLDQLLEQYEDLMEKVNNLNLAENDGLRIDEYA